MDDPVLFGATYSVYTRIVRLVLLEKAVQYRFEEVDIFDPSGPPASYLRLHPFGRIPALRHEQFELYEAVAISRYVDDCFPGIQLQPAGARGRARVAQIVSILDSYAYRPMVWDTFVERVRKPQRNESPDEQKIEAAVARSKLCLEVLQRLMGEDQWLVGDELSLADLHAAPMIAYFAAAPEGAAALARHPRLLTWWDQISMRVSMRSTTSPLINR
jgi:glutathione S-transferase